MIQFIKNVFPEAGWIDMPMAEGQVLVCGEARFLAPRYMPQVPVFVGQKMDGMPDGLYVTPEDLGRLAAGKSIPVMTVLLKS